MSTLEQAISAALEAHNGQTTRSGRPYIIHPLHVMNQMDTVEEMITAVLHDVIEDSNKTLDEIKGMGFTSNVIDALALLTHDEEDDYETYIEKIQGHPLATKVKLADLKHNMDLRRLPLPMSERDCKRFKRYRRAWKTLTGK